MKYVLKVQLLKYLNRLVAIAYLLIDMKVIAAYMLDSTNIIGTTLIIGGSIIQIYGHLRNRLWALKITAAIWGIINILALFYLLPIYPSEMNQPLFERLILFVGITLISITLVSNFYLSQKYAKRT